MIRSTEVGGQRYAKTGAALSGGLDPMPHSNSGNSVTWKMFRLPLARLFPVKCGNVVADFIVAFRCS